MTPLVEGILAKLQSGEALTTEAYELVHCQIYGQPVTFCLDREHDPIQRNHRLGQFYEAKELEDLRAYVRPGDVVADIGSNIGNHSLYFAMFLAASRVIPIEPNPQALKILISNVVLNRLTNVIDLSKLGVGASDTRLGGYAVEQRKRNIGAARMIPGEGDIETYPGDELLADIKPDFIKIDVEGMELRVLDGLAKTISNHRPTLFVEVDNQHEEAFLIWADNVKYRLEKTWQRYKGNKNHLLLPT